MVGCGASIEQKTARELEETVTWKTDSEEGDKIALCIGIGKHISLSAGSFKKNKTRSKSELQPNYWIVPFEID